MKTTKEYIFITTPSHGYLRVPLGELSKLGIADKVSSYSRMDSRYAYLEEDCDAPLFLNSIPNGYSITVNYSEILNKPRSYETQN